MMKNGVTVQQVRNDVHVGGKETVVRVGGTTGPRGPSAGLGDVTVTIDPAALFNAAYDAAKV